MSEHVALFAAGLGLLAAGAGALVAGAARLDRATGRGAFAVGVVAVGFGPCAAGLAFDLAAVLRPAPYTLPRIALGNIVGGSVAGVGLALGLAALVRPVAATAKLFATAIPVLFAVTLLFWFLAGDKVLSRTDGGVLLTAFAGAAVLLVRAARREPDAAKAEFAAWVPERLPVWQAAVFALAGLAAVVSGAVLAAEQAIETARYLRVTGPVLGVLSSVATSLPAVVAAVLAARRGRPNVALGVAVGAVLVNLSLVAGVVALARPLVVDERAILEQVPVLALFVLLLLPVLANGLRVPRWEGALLLAAYAGFMAWQLAGR